MIDLRKTVRAFFENRVNVRRLQLLRLSEIFGVEPQHDITPAHRILRIHRRRLEFPDATAGQGLDATPRQHRRHAQLRQGHQHENEDKDPFHAAAADLRLNNKIFPTRNPAPTTINPSPRVTKLSSLSKKRLIASAAIRSKPKFARATLLE